jgi:hypothetical protein
MPEAADAVHGDEVAGPRRRIAQRVPPRLIRPADIVLDEGIADIH